MRQYPQFTFCVHFLIVVVHVLGYEIRPPTVALSRRNFVATTTTVSIGVATLGEPVQAFDIKVTPLAHTFITSSGTPKPIRENDATRFFTNAKVVFLLEGKDANLNLSSEVLDLTCKRKTGEGPGVTPGKVRVLSSNKALIEKATSLGLETTFKKELVDTIIATAQSMPEGDVLLVGPIPSGGVAADGKLIANTAAGLGTFVGGKVGKGVISVLLDGPRQDIKFEAGGYPVSELLWFNI